MTPYDVATAKVAIAGALAALLAASFVLERDAGWRRRAFGLAFALVLGASTLAYFNLGAFRFGGGVINVEQHHFFLGSKYLPEIRYDGLYDATVAGHGDGSPRPKGHDRPRPRPSSCGRSHELSPSRPRGRASRPERWQAFSSDNVAFFFRKLFCRSNA
jgi:hypothetical protein